MTKSAFVGIDSGGTRTNVEIVVDDGRVAKSYEVGHALSGSLPPSEYASCLRRVLAPLEAAIDDLGEEWPLLMEFDDFPFAELKVDRAYINGCADDRLKQATCRSIVELADRFGARTVAEGVETRADFVMARELEFDIIQGFFFAKPMEPHKFARRVLGKPVTLSE